MNINSYFLWNKRIIFLFLTTVSLCLIVYSDTYYGPKWLTHPLFFAETTNYTDNSFEIRPKHIKNNVTEINNQRNSSSTWEIRRISENLGRLVRKRIEYIQNPRNCSSARKLICDLTFNAGYGSLLHHVVVCLIAAYATNRTLILEKEGWKYARTEGWESVFQPLSKTCTVANSTTAAPWQKLEVHTSEQVVKMPHYIAFYWNTKKYDFVPHAVPADLAERIIAVHSNPIAWWIGQFVNYLTRPNTALQNYFDEKLIELNFSLPIVGIHIRRTDKLRREARRFEIEDYMVRVERWFNASVKYNTVKERRVYIATDDVRVINETIKQYPRYMFINNMAQQMKERWRRSIPSLYNVLLDIFLLSKCNYVVCTFSSNICSAVYEEMQTHHIDASRLVKSLDYIYYFYGASHTFTVVANHLNATEEELELKVGDTISRKFRSQNRNPDRDGICFGTNLRTKQAGLFPINKTVTVIHRVEMPVYAEVDG